ncbi:hypothetical protein QYF36_005077 [Acer negundo]|nr:hypothetical protein QYF36_005077 [Acer negundo]
MSTPHTYLQGIIVFRPAVKCKIDEFPPLIHLVPFSFVVLDEVILLEINSVNSMPDVSKLGGENAGSCGFFEGQEAKDVGERNSHGRLEMMSLLLLLRSAAMFF